MTYPRSCNISMVVGRDYYFYSLQSISYFRLEYIFQAQACPMYLQKRQKRTKYLHYKGQKASWRTHESLPDTLSCVDAVNCLLVFW